MTNEDRLHAVRWAALTRLELNKGDKWVRRRDQLAIEMIDRELEMGIMGYSIRSAEALALDWDMEVAFERIAETPAEEDQA